MLARYVRTCNYNSATHPRNPMGVTWYDSPSTLIHEGNFPIRTSENWTLLTTLSKVPHLQ